MTAKPQLSSTRLPGKEVFQDRAMERINRLIVLTLAFALASAGDTLRMRDGSTVNGDFMGATWDDIRFSVNGEIQHYARTNVAEIIFSGAPADVPAPANPAPVSPASSEPDWVVKGPDYAGAPFLRGASGFLALEKEYASPARSGGVYGMGGGGTTYRIQGGRSNVRVRQGQKIVFVVRFDGGGDPRQFQLFRLESRMNYRQTQATMSGGPAGLPLTIQKVADSVYEITPARSLPAGEYSVSPSNSNDSYCFGVDY
jgi:hypothetical protein